MGSSPVTATIGSSADRLLKTLEEFLGSLRTIEPEDPVHQPGPLEAPSEAGREEYESPPRLRLHSRPLKLLVAFSGGPDSLALLLGLVHLSSRFDLTVECAHFDHGLDDGSSQRADRAEWLASELGVPCHRKRAETNSRKDGTRRVGRGVEADARAQRYRFLEGVADRVFADAIAVAHHADDQAETVCLRLLFGSGIAGLSGMRPQRGRLLRPLLGLDRALVSDALVELSVPLGADFRATIDPTNANCSLRRNFVRHRLLPRLGPEARVRLLALADAAHGARQTVERRLDELLPVRAMASGPGLELAALRSLPAVLVPWALARLHRSQGEPYPPPQKAIRELQRQLAAAEGENPNRRLRCHAGGDRSWEVEGDYLVLSSIRSAAIQPTSGRWPTASDAIAGSQDGSARLTLELPSFDLRFTLERRPVAPWMRRGERWRTALTPTIADGTLFTLRSRRPGDRLRPLGCDHDKRLKALLIDAKIPRPQREVLPLLCIESTIAWVPGVTIDHRFRLQPADRYAWVAELSPLRS